MHHTSYSTDVEVDNKDLSFKGPSNLLFFSESPTLDKNAYFKPDLLGGFMQYEVDLSKVGCNCVTQVLGLAMPAVDETADEFGYCTAHSSEKCPQQNIMVANKYGFKANTRSCEAPNADGIFEECD